MTAAPTSEDHSATPTPEGARRPAWVVITAQVLGVLVVFAAAGIAGGFVWYHLWDPPSGVVSGGVWYTDEAGLRASFTGVALYVVIGVVGGLVLGAGCAWWLDRSELATLVAVLAGSALAAYLMLRIGQHLSPPDPQVIAKTAKDGAKVKGELQVDAWPPRAAFSFGALLALAIVYAGSIRRPGSSEAGSPDGTRG